MLPVVKTMLDNNPHSDYVDLANTIAVTSHVPLIVIFYYLMYYVGNKDSIINSIQSLKTFYGYENILNSEPYLKNINE